MCLDILNMARSHLNGLLTFLWHLTAFELVDTTSNLLCEKTLVLCETSFKYICVSTLQLCKNRTLLLVLVKRCQYLISCSIIIPVASVLSYRRSIRVRPIQKHLNKFHHDPFLWLLYSVAQATQSSLQGPQKHLTTRTKNNIAVTFQTFQTANSFASLPSVSHSNQGN